MSELLVKPVDAVLATDEPFAVPEPEALRDELLVEAVERQFAGNERWATFCEGVGFGPDNLKDARWLEELPLLPTQVFKRPDWWADANLELDGLVLTTSSGTSGTRSVIPRDDTTLGRFFATIEAGAHRALGIETGDVLILNLGPPVDATNDLWISYVMAGLSVSHEARYYVHDGEFDVAAAADDYRQAAVERTTLVVGPPVLLERLAGALGRSPSPGPGSAAIAIGGWKTDGRVAPARADFDRHIAVSLGLSLDRVRDAYNMVELNTALIECAQKRKHVPPWLFTRAVRPAGLTTVPAERSLGILGFADATATSYPSFILSEDLGTISRGVSCSCGVTSDVVDIVRRVQTVESRGCALRMDRLVGKPIEATSRDR